VNRGGEKMDKVKFESAVKGAGGKIGFLVKGFYNHILTALADGEKIVAAGECIDTKGPGAIIVTDRHLYASKGTGMLSSAQVTIPLEKISSYSLSGGLTKNLNVTEGTMVHTFPQVTNPDGIVAAIKAGKDTPQASPADTATELRKFKSLLDDGIITQEDFNKKKAALLGL
jgi:hypothetical protein